jgi:hypothetical protein
MVEPTYHLAQFNIAKMRAPLEDPVMAGFVEQLEYINSVADRAEGFVWRMQTEEGDSTAIRAYGDEPIIVNMSVWESLAALHDYVYQSDHLAPMRNRRAWFERSAGPTMVLWWIPEGTIPSVADGKARLDHLVEHGPTAAAFTFKKWFPPPGSADDSEYRFDFTGCDWRA